MPLLRRDGNRISKHMIERLYQEVSGNLNIVDYKTGTDSANTREHWANQLQCYSALLLGLDSAAVSGTLAFQASDNQVIDLNRKPAKTD